MLSIIWDAICDIIDNVVYFIKTNLMNFANTLNFIAPYVTLYIGAYLEPDRHKIIFGFGNEIFIPIVFALVIYILKLIANKTGKGINLPVPAKRFTQVDDDGEVSIENDRIQELILYLADFEDWLERKGML